MKGPARQSDTDDKVIFVIIQIEKTIKGGKYLYILSFHLLSNVNSIAIYWSGLVNYFGRIQL